jgi:hypothetical protein
MLGEIAARSASRTTDAEQRYGAALALARDRGFRPLEALARLGLGQMYARGGRRDAADRELDAARALLTELGMTRWLPAVAGPYR